MTEVARGITKIVSGRTHSELPQDVELPELTGSVGFRIGPGRAPLAATPSPLYALG